MVTIWGSCCRRYGCPSSGSDIKAKQYVFQNLLATCRSDDGNHFSDNWSIRLSISCPTASPGITSACNFVLAAASESRDSCGRTYGRLSLSMLLEVFLSEVDLICFPAYVWEWRVAE